MIKFVLIILIVFLLSENSFTQNYGGWITADSLIEPRESHSSVLLNDTSILVSGGTGDGYWLSTCEIYNPVLNEWRQTNSMNTGRGFHHSVLLKNDKVLIIGGYKLKSCEIFDPQTETWIFTDSLNARRRFNSTATLLNNGKVLVIGGYDIPDDSIYVIKLNNCELYDPATNAWSITDSLRFERWAHSATLMKDGRVLVCGGDTLPCEIFDPVSETWSIAASMLNKRDYQSAVLLPDGKVLVSGGYSSSSWFYDCEIYNPVNDVWTPAGTMQFPRNSHSSIILQNSLILFAGGEVGSSAWELYDPVTMQAIYWDYYPVDKYLPTMHLLRDGRVISIGGTSWIGTYFFHTNMCEIYDPSLNNINEKNKTVSSNVHLFPNYPNPFNPSTLIKYYLPVKANVKLKIYDLTGKLIRTLVNENKFAGFHTITFNAQNLASGVYLVTMKADNYFRMMKIIKLK